METPRENYREDGYAVTYEAAIAALKKRSGIAVDSTDPLLDVVTLNNLYLDALHRLMLRHEKAMKETMLDVVRDTATRFDEVVALLRANTIENSLSVIREHQKAMTEHRAAVRDLARTVMIFCGTSLGATLAMLFMIFRLARGV